MARSQNITLCADSQRINIPWRSGAVPKRFSFLWWMVCTVVIIRVAIESDSLSWGIVGWGLLAFVVSGVVLRYVPKLLNYYHRTQNFSPLMINRAGIIGGSLSDLPERVSWEEVFEVKLKKKLCNQAAPHSFLMRDAWANCDIYIGHELVVFLVAGEPKTFDVPALSAEQFERFCNILTSLLRQNGKNECLSNDLVN